MSYSSWVGQLPHEFWLSALFGTFATILYAINEFAQPTFEREPDKPETAFAPAELASGGDYIVSFCLYLAGLLTFYWLVCLIGPVPFTSVGLVGDVDTSKLEIPGAFPLYVAMLLIGVLPRVPMLSYFEQAWRKLMHARARIPQAVLVRSSDLRRAGYDFAAFQPLVVRRDGMFARNVAPSDIAAPPTTASHRWARLSAILQQLSTLEADRVAAQFVDPSFLDRHRTTLSTITADYLRLADRIAHERVNVRASPAARFGIVSSDGAVDVAAPAYKSPDGLAVPDECGEQIEALLRRVCMLIACAMLKTPDALRAPDAAMHAFGFLAVPTSDVVSEVDVVIKAMVGSVLAYCIFVFLSFRIGMSLPTWMSETGWPAIELGNDRLQYIVTFVLPQFAAIGGALMLRHTFRRRRGWFHYEHSRPMLPPARKYVAIAMVSFVLALLVSSYLAGAWQGADKILDDLYWRFFEGFVPATSALFVCLAIDMAIVDRSIAQRRLIAAVHTVLATIVALGAADHFYTNDKGLDFTGAVLYSAAGTLLYAGALAILLLVLATRDVLVRDADQTQLAPAT